MSDNKLLNKRILSGSLWIVAFEVSNQILQFIKTFYAATLLSPSDFGIVGFAFLIIAFLEILSTTGMKEAVIQKKDNLQPYLDTVWVIEFTKGTIVLVFTFLLAPFFANIIQPANGQLTEDIIRFIGCIYFLQSSTSIGVLYFEKDIQFNKFFFYQFSGTIADVTVSLILVSYLQNVWALFYGAAAGAMVRTVASFLLSSYRPKFRFDLHRAKELLRFGKWIFSGKLFNFVGLQSDSIIVSSVFSLHLLGIYQMAFRIGNLPMSQVSNVIGRIAFPTFSKLQDDRPKLKDFFLSSINILSIALLPVVVLVFILIQEFTVLFLGIKWGEIVPIVKVLILSGLLRIFVSLIDSLFSALGEPKYSSHLQSTRFVVFILVVFPLGYIWGILGVAISGMISLLVVALYFLRKASLKLNILSGELIVGVFYPLAYAMFTAAILYGFKKLFYDDSAVTFFLLVAFFVFIYLGIGVVLSKYSRLKVFGKAVTLFQNYIIKT